MAVFSTERRRARLARRHALADRAQDPAAVAESMVVLHASDPATVYLSALARMERADLDAVSTALYDDRSLIRVLAMRRTLFVLPLPLLDVVEQSSTVGVAANERKRLEKFLADNGIDDPTGWLAAAAAEVVEVLSGPEGTEGMPARNLTAAVPRLATKIVMGAGTRHAVATGATSRVLAVLANEGLLVRGRPVGGWTDRTYRWHLRHQWLGSAPALPAAPAGRTAAAGPSMIGLTEASGALVERWLRAFGPAPMADIRWWTGWTVRQVKAALATLDVAEVRLEGGSTGLVMADDVEAPDDAVADPWVALLPSLDPTPMGWKERDWFLGPHGGPLFDRNGNIGPTVWVDGRIVGGWSQVGDGEIVTSRLEDIGADHRALIETEAERLTAAIAPTVVKPSFPTPLQRELSASG